MSNVVVKHIVKINPYDKASINAAVNQMKALQRTVEWQALKIRHAVAEAVQKEADRLYHESWYNDWVNREKEWGACPTTLEESEQASIVVAHGEKAVFVEFGTGVHHNHGLLLKSPHLFGMELGFTIGSYPFYHGVPSWGQYDKWYVASEGDWTRGTEAQMVLYRAVRYTIPNVEDIVKEVIRQ